MTHDELGISQASQSADRAGVRRGGGSRRGAGNGHHRAELSVADLEALAVDLVHRVGIERALFMAALLQEAAEAAEAEGGA